MNSLVRLNTIAVFNGDAGHAKTVLQIEEGKRTYDLRHQCAVEDPEEVAISRCLELIAEQACEIADAVTQLLESDRPVSSRLISDVPRAARLKQQACLIG